MRKIVLVYTLILSVLMLSACGAKKEAQETPSPAPTNQSTQTAKPTKESTDVPAETASVSEPPASASETEAALPEEEGGFIQKEGAISLEDAISILKTFLGSYDENGNEFSFDYENTIEKGGRDYYNFRVTSLIPGESGTAHQSVYGNYIISSDGMDIEEYMAQP